MDSFSHLPELPGTAREQAWLRERLETLSVRKGIILSAVLARQPPRKRRGRHQPHTGIGRL